VQDQTFCLNHKTSPTLRWDVVCQALRKQFRDTRTDVDIREALRDRKQKEGANFDSPYEAIIQMMDGLEVPLKEFTKVDILKRNWRPEIRHELLNVSIHSLDLFMSNKAECNIEVWASLVDVCEPVKDRTICS